MSRRLYLFLVMVIAIQLIAQIVNINTIQKQHKRIVIYEQQFQIAIKTINNQNTSIKEATDMIRLINQQKSVCR